MITVIYNKATKNSTINIIGEIGNSFWSDGITLNGVMSQIQNDSPEGITLNVASLGGDLFEALAIHDYLKSLPKKKTCNIIGNTASSGTIIAMASDEILISENSRFLIHKASAGLEGTGDEFQQKAEQLQSFDNTISDIYVKRTGMTKDAVLALMKENRWMTAGEAVNLKFCDGILKTITNIKKTSNMDEQQIAALQAENEALKAKIAELESKLAGANDTLENIEQATIENEIQAAIEAGKIEDTEKEVYQNFGKGNVKALSEKFKMMKPKNRVFVQPPNVTVTAEMDWDYFHKKNPKQLAQLKASDRKTFNSLYFAKFGKYPTEGK